VSSHQDEPGPLPAGVRTRKRVAMLGGGAMFGLFIAFPLLASFTALLDGSIGGVGVAYIVGFLEIVLAMAAAIAYCAWADRVESPRGSR
jgi:uncharacterized membrane protein (DUF485 family)